MTSTPTQVFAAAHMGQIGAFTFPDNAGGGNDRAWLVRSGWTHIRDCPQGYIVAQYEEDELHLCMWGFGTQFIAAVKFDAPNAECPPTTLSAFVAVVNAWSTK